MMLKKILLCFIIVSILVCSMALSVFADTSGNGATDTFTSYNGGAPNLIMFGGVNFALNNYAATSSNVNKVGSSFVCSSVPYANGLQYRIQSTYLDYIDSVYVYCDELIFTLPSSDFVINTPYYVFESYNQHFSIIGVTLYLDNVRIIEEDGDIRVLPDMETQIEYSPYRSGIYSYDINSLLELYSVVPGEVVYCTPSFAYDVEYDTGDKFFFTVSAVYTGFDGNLTVPIFPVYETVDVLSWLPNTIDSFLDTELFPGVNFGTLLLMVIAVPAIFAVLKMLGGGG